MMELDNRYLTLGRLDEDGYVSMCHTYSLSVF